MTSSKGQAVQPNMMVLEDSWGESELGDAPHYMYKKSMNSPMLFGNALQDVLTGKWALDVLAACAWVIPRLFKHRTFVC
jgi:hypothetical protein